MKEIRFTLAIILSLIGFSAFGQETFPVNGPYDERDDFYAFTNVDVVVSADKKITDATLVIKKGKVVSVSSGGSTPQGAVVYDLTGKTIYPSFIDVYSSYGLQLPNNTGGSPFGQGPQFVSKKEGAYSWNEAVKPEIHAHELFKHNSKEAEALRKEGFGAVLSHVADGIARGTGVLATLGDENEHEIILKDKASSHYSFRKGVSRQNYPSSLMGSIALLRQTHYDAQWYKNNSEKEYNISLAEWNAQSSLPAFFEVRDVLTALRADKLGDEIGKQFVIKGGGDEYKRIDDLKKTNATFIIPLNFPEPYDVTDPLDAEMIDLSDMLHWEYAPYNAGFLEEQRLPFVLTASGLKDKKTFLKNLRTAVKKGLSEKKAIQALTSDAANLIGAGSMLGSLESGKMANFFIANGNIFEGKTKILANWVNGQPYVFEEYEHEDLSGDYDLKIAGKSYQMLIEGDAGKHGYKVKVNDTTEFKTKATYSNDVLSLSFTEDGKTIRLTGWRSGKNFKGTAVTASGSETKFSAIRTGDIKSEDEKDKKDKEDKKKEDRDTDDTKPSFTQIPYPFNGYGWKSKPVQKAVLFKNATVWTSEDEGILENTDVLIKDGKIAKIGKNLSAGNATEVDATGKHLTAGIIDEHAHIAISRGVNEGTQASSAEVSIGDVVNSEHVAVYRLLGGGVTAAQLLHGSANPIGGQSAIIKMRWGQSPEEMKIEGAAPFIKFALGENVKQSNWGDNNVIRYPQTRMGVEQVFIDHFTRAREYEKARKSNPQGTRRDLELEALLQILNKKRFVTCHSYVQSEINMLMQVAEMFNFNINTFTHILEGYKVADKMKEHGAGGSTFSDWWGYKYEVIDAIPHNAELMRRAGIVVAINSDDAEMGRRLNQEAAKLIKYGGMSEEEAWKTVTINPAKLLHLDDRMGSIKQGKDADVVLWSDSPLTVYAKAEQTYVDGRKLFDINEDLNKRKHIHKERERLIQAMLNDGSKNKKKVEKKPDTYYTCDTVLDEAR